jgi:hypothetical protein
MSVALDYTKLQAASHVTVAFYPLNGFADWQAPTATELNAAAPTAAQFSKSISWNDFDFGVQASNTIDDPSIADVGNVVDRGAAQYGGQVSYYFPGAYDDNSNSYSLTYDAVSTPRTAGYMVVRIDGNKPTTQAFAEGDYVHVLQVLSDAQTNVVTGEEAFRYTVNWLQQGNLAVYTVVQGAVDSPVVVTPGTLASSAGDYDRLNATVAAREYTNGVKWTTSDETIATVSSSGVVTSVAVGTATITATFAPTGETDTCAVTVS